MIRFQDSQPVLVKELRARMRGARAFWVLTVYLGVLSGFALLLYLAVRSSVANDPFTAGQTIGKVLFLGVAAVALIQVMIIVPAQAAGAISGERERETFDLLIVTLLPAWKIVLGKLFAALAYAVILVVAVVPLMALAFFFGGVTGAEVLIALTGLLVTAVLYGSVGILWSVIALRTMAATVLTQATNVMVLLGIPFFAYVFAAIFLFGGQEPDWLYSYPFVYAAGLLLAIHPFIALGVAEGFLSNGETGLLIALQSGNRAPVWIPAPWLAFAVEGLLVAAILIMIAIRLLRPVEARRGAVPVKSDKRIAAEIGERPDKGVQA
jgi:ABC-type transport system involved in multi-copper enzyme maturation permease subunit